MLKTWKFGHYTATPASCQGHRNYIIISFIHFIFQTTLFCFYVISYNLFTCCYCIKFHGNTLICVDLKKSSSNLGIATIYQVSDSIMTIFQLIVRYYLNELHSYFDISVNNCTALDFSDQIFVRIFRIIFQIYMTYD